MKRKSSSAHERCRRTSALAAVAKASAGIIMHAATAKIKIGRLSSQSCRRARFLAAPVWRRLQPRSLSASSLEQTRAALRRAAPRPPVHASSSRLMDGRHFWVISQITAAFKLKEGVVSNTLRCATPLQFDLGLRAAAAALCAAAALALQAGWAAPAGRARGRAGSHSRRHASRGRDV